MAASLYSRDKTDRSCFEEAYCIQRFLDIGYLVLEACHPSLCVDFHELVLTTIISR